MRLQAKRRLILSESGPSNTSIKGFLIKIGQMCGGQIPIRPENRDCRATVARAILNSGDPQDQIVIVGQDSHPVHALLVDAQGRKKADSFRSGTYSRKNGVYRCVLSNAEHVELTTLLKISVQDFKAKYVKDLPLHGHVVPRSDGLRAKCGGPSSILACAICARESVLHTAGLHPLITKQIL